jgi:hypothetical protein
MMGFGVELLVTVESSVQVEVLVEYRAEKGMRVEGLVDRYRKGRYIKNWKKHQKKTKPSLS